MASLGALHANCCHAQPTLYDSEVTHHMRCKSVAETMNRLFICLEQHLHACAFSLVLPTHASNLLRERTCDTGQSDKIKQTLKDKFWPTLLAGYAVWPLAHVINFRFIPNSQRVLYINAVNVSTLLRLSAALLQKHVLH